ncbi:Zinc finger HIT domain-containing protein 3 [Pseudolycoriella hygida]|uniref:Zinc finger HIT domain-containing protein 3 n=1 Tax=Pseudolycoriella hygida TaxID=35572 RepID=A0A9Q0NCD6_9DIPT|nr:Zinc finger HIT domain-containing protein 3 [Pseudolycoriella hygida]
MVKCNAEQTNNQVTNETTEEDYRQIVPFTTVDTVDPEKLLQLRNSEKLKDLLRNPHLREYLVQLDKSPNAWKAMKIAMLEPLFIEFADECLNIVEPNL